MAVFYHIYVGRYIISCPQKSCDIALSLLFVFECFWIIEKHGDVYGCIINWKWHKVTNLLSFRVQPVAPASSCTTSGRPRCTWQYFCIQDPTHPRYPLNYIVSIVLRVCSCCRHDACWHTRLYYVTPSRPSLKLNRCLPECHWPEPWPEPLCVTSSGRTWAASSIRAPLGRCWATDIGGTAKSSAKLQLGPCKLDPVKV